VENLNWDHGQHLHPDERFLSMVTDQISMPGSVGEYFDSEASPLNPYNHFGTFVYGTFPLFLNKAVAEWLSPDAEGNTSWTARAVRNLLEPFGVQFQRPDGGYTFNAGYNSNVVGRALSALFDVFTVALVFEIGRVLFNRRVGLAAAGLLALAPLHIQYSHFFGSETFLAFFATATIYFSIRIVKYGSGWNYFFAGVSYGLVLATKLSGLPVIIVPGLAVIIRMWPQLELLYARLTRLTPPWRDDPLDPKRFNPGLLLEPAISGIGILIIAGIVFRIFQPYAFDGPGFFDVFDFNLSLREHVLSPRALLKLEFINPTHYFAFSEKFTNDLAGLRNLQTGQDFPPNLQWIGRTPYLFPLQNIVFFGLGVPLALAVLGGMIYSAYRIVRRLDFTTFLLLAWVVVFFALIGGGFVTTMRYFLPIYPAMVLLAAYGLVSLWDFAASGRSAELFARLGPRIRPYASPALQAVVVLAVLGTFLWAMAFMGIYRQDISRVQASHWIYENVPEGSVLSFQEWDDGLPLRLPGAANLNYRHVTLRPYIPDSPEKVRDLVAGLNQVDYVIESSNRIYDSVSRIPARYPSTTLYYQYLFDGTLGFEKVGEFTNYPRLFGIEFPDQWSEEAFTVYDHPRVLIFKKTDAYSPERALALLNPHRAAGAFNVPPADAATNALQLRPDDLATQRAGGTWTDIFASGGIAARYPTLLWFAVIQLAALAVTPICFLLFRRLPDRGYLLSKPLGIVLLAYPVWLVVGLKLVHFTQATILVWLLILLAIGAVLAVRYWAELRSAAESRLGLILLSEVIFIAAFLLFLQFRMENPDLWHPFRGGEKPMDLAYLTATIRSTTLPPYDPWFAGGYINYYYLGQFFTATVAKLTAIVPEVAFNLAIPTFFAMTVAGAFSITYNLAATTRNLLRRRPGFRPIPDWSVVGAGVFGALFVALVGNLDGVGQMAQRLSEVSSWQVESSLPLVGPIANSIGGILQVVFGGAGLRDFDYWRPSRMMPPTISITEFPYFSFVFADLHAHMMAIPFSILAIGGSLAVATGLSGDRGTAREWLLVGLLGLIVGSLRWLNSWDYPPFLLLALAAVVIGEARLDDSLARTGLRLAGKCLLLIGLSVALYYPFLANYHQPVSGLEPTPETTPIHQYLAHFGLFLAAVAAWLLYQLYRAFRAAPVARVLRADRREGLTGAWSAYERMTPPEQLSISASLAITGVLVALVLIFVSRGETVIAAMLPVLVAVGYLAQRELGLNRPDKGVRLFVLAMLGLAFGLTLGVDLVVIRGDIVRMNTVFKFYLHLWLLLAMVAAFAAWYLLFVAWAPRKRNSLAAGLRIAGSVGLVALVLGALIYPLFATPVRLNERFLDTPRTLDGMAYMEAAVYHDAQGPMNLRSDYQGILWLRENVQGTPVIVEGYIPHLYRWSGRFSIYTGLPTVLGWDWHQKQQRGKFGGPVIDRRAQQVQQFYANPDPQQAIRFLSQFEVSYVIVGQLERLYFPAEGLAKFDAGLGHVLEVAYRNPELTIYRVAISHYDLTRLSLP
jgi:YYY domain-containing protein